MFVVVEVLNWPIRVACANTFDDWDEAIDYAVSLAINHDKNLNRQAVRMKLLSCCEFSEQIAEPGWSVYVK